MTLAIKIWDREYDPVTKTVSEKNHRVVTLACSECGTTGFNLDNYGNCWYTQSLDCDPATDWGLRQHDGDTEIGDDFEANDDGWHCFNGHDCDRDLQMGLDAYNEIVRVAPEQAAREAIERISIV